MFGVEPQGTGVRVRGVTLYEVRDGRVQEERGVLDVSGRCGAPPRNARRWRRAGDPRAPRGSFARYYIERHGLQAFLDLALEDAAHADQPELWQRLEAEWRGALAAIREF